METPKWLRKLAEQYAGAADVLARYPFKRMLGKGAYKRVYASGDFAVGVTMYEKQAKDEMRFLKRLARIGLRVVEVIEWVPFGKHDGGAMVMRRYRTPRKRTERIVAECKKVAAVLRRHRMDVHDLHVLLDRRGEIVLADPLAIYRRTKGCEQVFKIAEAPGYSYNRVFYL